MNKKSYQNGYFGITSFDYVKIFEVISKYFYTLIDYLNNVNAPCLKCNDTKSLNGEFSPIAYFSNFTLLRYGENFLVQLYLKEKYMFIPVDEQIPLVIRQVFETLYEDVTSDECIAPFTIKGDFMGNQICFYLDKYQALTIYKQINDAYIYTDMTISQKKKYHYNSFLYKQSFTFKSKGNCSC